MQERGRQVGAAISLVLEDDLRQRDRREVLAAGRVDEDATVSLMHRLIDSGADGLVIAGTTGEAATLSDVVETMDPQRLRGMLRALPSALRDRVQDYMAGLTPDQLSAIRGLQTRLAILTESHTGEFLRPGGSNTVAMGAHQGEIDLRAALSALARRSRRRLHPRGRAAARVRKTVTAMSRSGRSSRQNASVRAWLGSCSGRRA